MCITLYFAPVVTTWQIRPHIFVIYYGLQLKNQSNWMTYYVAASVD